VVITLCLSSSPRCVVVRTAIRVIIALHFFELQSKGSPDWLAWKMQAIRAAPLLRVGRRSFTPREGMRAHAVACATGSWSARCCGCHRSCELGKEVYWRLGMPINSGWFHPSGRVLSTQRVHLHTENKLPPFSCDRVLGSMPCNYGFFFLKRNFGFGVMRLFAYLRFVCGRNSFLFDGGDGSRGGSAFVWTLRLVWCAAHLGGGFSSALDSTVL
jgi:hypothetical protein